MGSKKYLTCSFEKAKNNILIFNPEYYSLPDNEKLYIITRFTDYLNEAHEMLQYMETTNIINISDNVREVIYVAGRGDIAVIEDIEKLPKKPIKLQDKVSIGSITYKVIGIENGYKSVGFLIKEEK